MCGIVGYIGSQKAAPILVEGLTKLEYRGYDSAGIAVLEADEDIIAITKSVGKLKVLENKLEGVEIDATVGIGHTRWATHGRPSDLNSHPHTDCTGDFAVVHNGIIENYLHLREWLQQEGHVFKSETDTEVLPHLVEHFYEGDLEATVRKVIEKVEGSYAMVVLSQRESDKLIAARKDSPMVVGLGDGEYFLASDIPALLKYTRRTYILNDGEIAVLTREGVKVTNLQGEPVTKEVFEVTWDPVAAEKDGFPHFMLKEIHEQPRALRDTMAGRISPDAKRITLENEIKLTKEDLERIKKITVVACGTAWHAGMVGKYFIEKLCRIPVDVEIASEFRYKDPIVDSENLCIAISQSGETADTLAAMREAKGKGAQILAITNVVSSSVARDADHVLYTWAGPEIAVASTKAYTTQVLAMLLVGLYMAQEKGLLDAAKAEEIIEAMKQLPFHVQEVLDNTEAIEGFAEKYKDSQNAFFIGRSLDYAVALEGSLKLKEISYMHAEAYPAGELKHGTLALITEEVPVIALATQLDVYDKMLSNVKEVKARDASVIALAFEGDKDILKSVDHAMFIPRTEAFVAPILAVVPLQLFSYYVSVARGTDVDKPRNLAKSVTVE